MATKTRNGCMPLNTTIKLGTLVQVMPRNAALVVSRKHGNGEPAFSTTADSYLRASGYMGKIIQKDDNNYWIRPLHCTGNYRISKEAVFGPAYNAGDVVEVGASCEPGVPPTRRCFVTYSFDHEFEPVIVTFDEEDTQSLLDDRNAACVDLTDSEIYPFNFPAPVHAETAPTYEVNVAKNGRAVRVRDLSRAEWCAIYDGAR